MRGLAAFAWLLLAGAAFGLAADDGDFARGRRLFESGIGRDGLPVKATVEGSAIPIPGGLLSCAGCHGWDGKGRSVSGLRPPDITWQSLTKPYAWRVGTGRTRPPYDPELVARVVTTGIDSAGQVLAAAMPRFQLTPGDTADLLVYLRELGARPDPGVAADTLTIGVLLPSEDEAAVRAALARYREQLNRAGGIFGRRIEFSFLPSTATPDEQRSASAVVTAQEGVVALLSIDDAAGRDIVLAADRAGVPLIALRPHGNAPPARNVFYLSAGHVGELSALLTYAARKLEPSRTRLVVAHRNNEDDDLIAGLRPRIQRLGWQRAEEMRVPVTAGRDGWPEAMLQQLACADAVLLVTAAFPDARMLRCSKPDHGGPLLLLPGSRMATGWLPQAVTTDIQAVVAFDPTTVAKGEPSEDAIGQDGGFRVSLAAVQQSAVAAAQLIVEALRRAGRDVTRPKLIDALETIQRFETNDLPPLNFAPRQHIGFSGAQIVPVDFRRGRLMEPIGRLQVE